MAEQIARKLAHRTATTALTAALTVLGAVAGRSQRGSWSYSVRIRLLSMLVLASSWLVPGCCGKNESGEQSSSPQREAIIDADQPSGPAHDAALRLIDAGQGSLDGSATKAAEGGTADASRLDGSSLDADHHDEGQAKAPAKRPRRRRPGRPEVLCYNPYK